jgi:hypothetical protein
MNTAQYTHTYEQSFRDFLFRNKGNRITLYLATAAIGIQFVLFKYLYPFPNYIHDDSFSYLIAANENLSANIYLIGYSKFLRLFSVFAKPDIALIGFQYLFIQSSGLFLLFTLFYFYKPSKIVQFSLLAFMVLNPLCLHLANLVSSDGFFLALSMIWFSLLIWLVNQPSNKIIFWHAIVLFISFTVRYNALIYPFISILVFCLSKMPLRKKILGLGLGLALCGWFVGFTMYQYKSLTGHWQYSPFSGWQLANNAMYAYRDVDPSLYTPVPKKFQSLDSMIRTYYKLAEGKVINPYEKAQASTFYMWRHDLPLMKYRDSLFKLAGDTSASELRKWASMGPFYNEYGIYLIKKYPLHYLSFFAFPNARKYFAPPVEFLENYNSGKSDVLPVAVKWFEYKNSKIKSRMKSTVTWILDFYPVFTGVINFLMLFGLFYFILLKGWKFNTFFNKLVIIASAIWLVNAVFTILASSAALRFQSFPILLISIFASLMIDWLIQLLLAMKKEQTIQEKAQKQLTHEAIA